MRNETVNNYTKRIMERIKMEMGDGRDRRNLKTTPFQLAPSTSSEAETTKRLNLQHSHDMRQSSPSQSRLATGVAG